MEDNDPGSLVDRARRLRKEPTDVEQKLWHRLRRNNLGIRFRRQVPIGSFNVDFACHSPKLIIELDGGQHSEQQEYDENRTEWLKSRGYHVLRFWNFQINQELEAVLEDIERRASELTKADAP